MTATQKPASDDVELIGSRVGRIDPDDFENQSGIDADDRTDNDENRRRQVIQQASESRE